jgi:hypothetical protein
VVRDARCPEALRAIDRPTSRPLPIYSRPRIEIRRRGRSMTTQARAPTWFPGRPDRCGHGDAEVLAVVGPKCGQVAAGGVGAIKAFQLRVDRCQPYWWASGRLTGWQASRVRERVRALRQLGRCVGEGSLNAGGGPMLVVCPEKVRVEAELAGGSLICVWGCCGRGVARASACCGARRAGGQCGRGVARCPECAGTHVHLPDLALLRRRDEVAVIGRRSR